MTGIDLALAITAAVYLMIGIAAYRAVRAGRTAVTGGRPPRKAGDK